MEDFKEEKKTVKIVVDIGNAKLKGIIGEMTTKGYKVIKYAEENSVGMLKSEIKDISALSSALGTLLDKLKNERYSVNKITVGISGNVVKAARGTITYDFFQKKKITDEDIEEFYKRAQSELLSLNSRMLHKEMYNIKVDKTDFDLDKEKIKIVKKAQGNISTKIISEVLLLYIDEADYKKYEEVVKKLNISIEKMYYLPYVAAKAVLLPEDIRGGVAMVDIGEGITDIVLFKNDKFIYFDSLPLGTMHFVNDISFLPAYINQKTHAAHKKNASPNIGLREAREIYEKYVKGDIQDENAYVKDGITYIGKYIREIVDYRCEGIAKAIAEALINSGFNIYRNRGIIITGGGTEVEGMARKIHDAVVYPVKKGIPVKLPGLETVNDKMAGVIGLFGDVAVKEVLHLREEENKDKKKVITEPVEVDPTPNVPNDVDFHEDIHKLDSGMSPISTSKTKESILEGIQKSDFDPDELIEKSKDKNKTKAKKVQSTEENSNEEPTIGFKEKINNFKNKFKVLINDFTDNFKDD